MKLHDLMQGIIINNELPETNAEIKGIAYHSGEVKEGFLFICIRGYQTDGHRYLRDAVNRGATVAIVEEINEDLRIPQIQVTNSRQVLAHIAANFYEHPTNELNTIGITGTNGKTSITHFLKSILEEAGQTVGTIGTLGSTINGKTTKLDNTTPESLVVQQVLAEMKKTGATNCLMEVSSHALQLHRVDGIKFSTGIFTNLSPDHLELHKTMDDYFTAKSLLFQMTTDVNIVNADDFYGQKLIKNLEKIPTKTLTYGIHEQADFYATNINYAFDKTTFTLHTPFTEMEMTLHLPGEIYLSNSLAAITAAFANGVDLQAIKTGLDKVKQISGRFEVVYEQDDFKVIIDFAHTEDALQKTMEILRSFVKGKIIVVFGVYADMSENGTDKRYGMGRVAAEYADLSVVTLDNPKEHDIEQIMKETTEAIKKNNGAYVAIPDRKAAIQYAIEQSNKNDFILLAGKGHEESQIIGDKEISFSEKTIVLDAMKHKRF